MKTAEQIAEKLWLKYADNIDDGWIERESFLAALKEYGEAVRQKAAGVCKVKWKEWAESPPLTATEPNARDCAAAIERMELP